MFFLRPDNTCQHSAIILPDNPGTSPHTELQPEKHILCHLSSFNYPLIPSKKRCTSATAVPRDLFSWSKAGLFWALVRANAPESRSAVQVAKLEIYGIAERSC